MATEPHGVQTYPVWVGNLKETVKDKDLLRVFSKEGTVASCKVMVDESGKSRKFGYVNFFNEAEAERAAEVKAGYQIRGTAIKTKGPRMLQQQGHYSPTSKASSPPVDYRPFMDCSFYVQGKECKKGESCPFRHNRSAKTNPNVCSQWMEKNCTNAHCPFRHPGSKESSKTTALLPRHPTAQKAGVLKCSCSNVFCPFRHPLRKLSKLLPVSPPSHVLPQQTEQLLKCGGRCGDASCRALFVSSEDLKKHVKMSRLPQCRYCRAIFLSEVEFRDHKKTCRARMSSESTDKSSYSSESADLEVLSETDSELSEMEAPGGNLHVGIGYPQLATTGADFIHRSASANVLASPKKRKGERRSSEGTNGGGIPLTPDHKKQNSKRKHSKRNVATGREKSSMDSEEYVPVESHFSPPLDPYGYDYDIGYSDEDDEEDDVVEYTPYEMARLLSLNEQDMYESDSEDDELEEEEEVPLINAGQKQKNVQTKRKKVEHNEPKMQGGLDHRDMKSPHRVKLEPVGIFWDIENCSVPPGKSAFSLATKMRRVFFEGKREAEFMCVCDITKERKEVVDALQKAQVTLVHVNAIAKNAADDKLRQSLRRFAHTYPAPSTVVLISGDVNFSPELNDLRHIHNITIVLVHNPQASEALKTFANKLINYEEFLVDIEAPSEQTRSNLSRIVIVSGLPVNVPTPRLSSRLDQISDNCGGKVLRVDAMTGTARVLFRTQEWATKARKRMNGENVFGAKITTSLEPPSTYQPQQHQSQRMRQLSGPELANTFPPNTKKQPVAFPSQSPPPRAYQQHPPRPNIPPPQSHPHPGLHVPVHTLPPHPAGLPFNVTRGYPPQGPQPYGPPVSTQRPPYSYPPLYQPTPFPQPPQQLPKGPIPRPEGKILIFKIPPIEATQLEAQVVSIRLEACVKAEHMILWHSFAEVQVILQVDFINTATVRKEDMIRTLYEKGELRPQVADRFMEQCTKSISDVVQRLRLPWEVTTCGWSSEEEEDRVVRSQVIGLLKMFVPQYWTRWERFKKKYSELYSAAISEMAVHLACKGAVQILGNADSKDQVIVFYELSPLVKIVNNHQLHQQLQMKFVKLLSSQPEKIKLLDFVRVFNEANIGRLPVSSSGKLLQEIITGTPGITLVGAKPSNIHVTLNPQASIPRLPVPNSPHNLTEISADFRKLLMNFPNFQIPFRRFQQEYQTFFHHSFRVSDYLSGENVGVRELIEKCDGITMKNVRVPNGKMEVVCLTTQPGAQPTQPVVTQPTKPVVTKPTQPVVTKPTQPVAAYKPPARGTNDITQLTRSFQNLLKNSPNNQLPLSKFQQEYQTFFHKSFRVSDYIPGSSIGLKELLHFCEGITLKDVLSEGGKKETLVCLQSEFLPKSQRNSSSTSSDTSTGSIPTATTNSTSPIPQESIQLFRQECIDVMRTVPDGKLPLNRFPEMYTKVKGRTFKLAKFNAKKLIHLIQALPDVVQVMGDNQDKVIHLVARPDTIEDCEMRIAEMLYSLPHQNVYLDRFNNEYEKKFGVKLSNFYGHSKLVKLLEHMPNTVEISGNGPGRTVRLHHLKLLSMEMFHLLSFSPSGLPINMVVPKYKETFGRDFDISRYGYPKLIRALEAIPDVVDIRGQGPTRVIFLKAGTKSGTKVKKPASEQSLLPPPYHFADEIAALLVSQVGYKMTMTTLTDMYNTAFRSSSSQPKVSVEQLQEALKKLASVKLTGTGPGQCVHLVQQPVDISQESKKSKPKTIESSADVTVHTLPPITTSIPAAGRDVQLMTNTVPYGGKPSVDSTTIQSVPSSTSQPSVVMAETEAKRLCSESHRLLMRHPEHAMTLTELLDYFKSSEDPTNPTADQLYQALIKNNKKAGSGSKNPPKNFQISYIPSSIGDSVIQLNQSDCLVKLCQDLLYLFIYHPTVEFTMSLSELESLYAECYGHKLIPAVYAEKGIPQLLVRKQINKAINFDQVNLLCVVTENSRRVLLASLLAELLFIRGEDCSTIEMLPTVYQQHFGVPLHFECFAVDNVETLLSLPEISNVVRLVDGMLLQPKPVLTTSALFGEQMRQILTLHNGRILLDQLKTVYSAEFGIRTDINIDSLVDKKLIRLAPQIVNLSGYKWMVWAPSGRPYPKRVHTNVEPSAVNTNTNNDVPELVTLVDVDGGQITSHTGAPNEIPNSETEQIMANSELSTVETTSSPETVDDLHKITKSSVNASEEIGGSHDGRDSPIVSQEYKVSVHPLYEEFGALQLKVDDDTLLNAQDCSSKDAPNSTPSLLENQDDQDKAVSQHTTAESYDIKHEDAMDPSPYGFLERDLDPKLITEVTGDTSVDEDEGHSNDGTLEVLSGVPFTDAAIELLLKFARPLTDDFDNNSGDSDQDTGERKQEKEVPVPNEPIDYLASGMNPDEVLEEMQKVKQRSGGVLTTEQMDPFLTYFGELSSRELDRLEALEKKEKPKKETQKKKRVMAARFPGQSSAPPPSPPNPYFEHHLQQMEFLKDKLPVAPDLDNLSDSDSDGSCPHPIAREESIRLLMERGLPDIPINKEDIFSPVNSSKVEQCDPGSEEDAVPKGQVTECNIPQPLLDPSEAIQDSTILFPDPPLFDEDEHVPVLNDHLLYWPDFSQPVNGQLEGTKHPSTSQNS